MDVLVGVRLHSLIHAAIMEVPMIGVSYDPKVNAFLRSMDLKALCSVYDFKGEYLVEEFDKVWRNRTAQLNKVRRNKAVLIDKLNQNEVLIGKLLGEENTRG
jgi:polysaccharide pyruvyl transferase WcaK-like protein